LNKEGCAVMAPVPWDWRTTALLTTNIWSTPSGAKDNNMTNLQRPKYLGLIAPLSEFGALQNEQFRVFTR
jgi:hypothetical protein